jgi:hypothetical protein
MTESQQYGAVWNDQIMEGSGLVAITDRAQENMNYVHRLLKTNQPEFAALLEQLEREWSCPRCCDTFPVIAVAASSRRAQTLLAVPLGLLPASMADGRWR